MSQILHNEAFVDSVLDAVAPPPPPPPPPVSVERAMETIEAATRSARAAAARTLDASDPNIIRIEPRLSEMSALDMMRRAQPYIAHAALALGVLLFVFWLLQMRARYRRHNVADAGTSRRPMDRRSIARQQRKAAKAE